MKKPIIIIIICVALTFILLFWGFQLDEKTSEPASESYALVIQSDTGTFVMQLRKGMQQAADELGVQLAVCTLKELDQLERLSGAALWLDAPAQALSQLAQRQIPAVVVGQSVPDAVCVLGDDESAGKQLILYALSRSKDSRVVLMLDSDSAHSALRSRAALEWAKQHKVTVMNYKPGIALPDSCEIVVAPSLRSTLDMAARKQSGAYQGMVAGVDMGDSRVTSLEDGLVTAMVLDSPYAMGYLALNRLRDLATAGDAENAYAKVLLATQNNMYLSQNVKQVFPLLH